MDINELSKEIHKNMKQNGFWDKPNIGEKLMLVVSELGEALEAHRKGRINVEPCGGMEEVTNIRKDEDFKHYFEGAIKDSFEDELADTCIRIFDLAAHLNIDLQGHIEAKVRYNKMRPYKHGKNY